jgi:hypothetical protein
MSSVIRLQRLRLQAAIAVCVATAFPSCVIGQEADALLPHNAAISESSISGISSGGFMAVQFAMAWSSIVKGVGVVAGGPYFCAQATAADIISAYLAPIMMATGPCMTGPPSDLARFIREADEKAKLGDIDPTSHLSVQKVYIFHGFNDAIVAESVTDAAAKFYRHYLGEAGRGNLFYQSTVGAGHSQVLVKGRHAQDANACPANQIPYINECDYDQAGIILQHIYGALNPPSTGRLGGSVKSFSQAKYTSPDKPGALSMGDTGYLFVPKDCEPGQGFSCRVHVALHGCRQDAGDIGTRYVDEAGYNAWADANRIIVLYPQAVARPALGSPPSNPEGCWDWWSYVTHDDSYVTKSGRQIKAIKAMLDALTGGQGAGRSAIGASLAIERLAVIDRSDDAVDLAWTPVEGATAYRVFRAGADGAFAQVGETTGPSYADNGLRPATTYRWRVAAIVGEREGPASGEAVASTLMTPERCDKPGQCPTDPQRREAKQ